MREFLLFRIFLWCSEQRFALWRGDRFEVCRPPKVKASITNMTASRRSRSRQWRAESVLKAPPPKQRFGHNKMRNGCKNKEAKQRREKGARLRASLFIIIIARRSSSSSLLDHTSSRLQKDMIMCVYTALYIAFAARLAAAPTGSQQRRGNTEAICFLKTQTKAEECMPSLVVFAFSLSLVRVSAWRCLPCARLS